MEIFNEYARYYNLIYRDKNYAEEASFALELLGKAGRRPSSVLDLGCGTGRHALEIARTGVEVVGVDMSELMLRMGQDSRPAANSGRPEIPKPVLLHADARTVRLNRQFDAVISLFHVMSYQSSYDDAMAVMKTAHAHLAEGGLFLFDFWYGPGVLTDPPLRRSISIEDGLTDIRREAVPEHLLQENIVDVKYRINITDKTSGKTSTIKEIHRMRYWFLPELRYLLEQCQLRPLAAGAWMKNGFEHNTPWYAWLLAQKTNA